MSLCNIQGNRAFCTGFKTKENIRVNSFRDSSFGCETLDTQRPPALHECVCVTARQMRRQAKSDSAGLCLLVSPQNMRVDVYICSDSKIQRVFVGQSLHVCLYITVITPEQIITALVHL